MTFGYYFFTHDSIAVDLLACYIQQLMITYPYNRPLKLFACTASTLHFSPFRVLLVSLFFQMRPRSTSAWTTASISVSVSCSPTAQTPTTEIRTASPRSTSPSSTQRSLTLTLCASSSLMGITRT